MSNTPVSQIFYVVGQGAELYAPFSVAVNGVPVDVTNSTFKATLKTDYSLPDTDPTVVMIDWSGNEGSNPTGGQAALIVPPSETQTMTVTKYYGQVRGGNIPQLPSVTDLFFFTVDITPVVSNRF